MSARQRQAFDFFISRGWSAEQSAGIVANLQAESGMRHEAVGDGGRAYGLAQWHPPRQAGFEALFGKPIQKASFEEQLHWVHAELQGTEKAAGDALAYCRSAAEAGECVSRRYERPADIEGEARKRAALAETIYQQYAGVAPAPTQPEPVPIAPAPVLPPPPPEKPMFAMLLPALLGLIPHTPASARPEEIPWRAVACHARIVPYWLARDVDGLETVCRASGVSSPDVRVPAWRLFPEAVEKLPSLKEALGLEIAGDRSVSAYVAPRDVPTLLDFLNTSGSKIIGAATRAGEGPACTALLRKIKECAVYAAGRRMGYLEASGIEPPDLREDARG